MMHLSKLLAIPAIRQLSNDPRWVTWRAEQDTETGKTAKVPYSAYVLRDTGAPHRASATNPKHHGLLRTAIATAQASACSGIGAALGGGVGGLDLDGCRNAQTGVIAPWAIEIMAIVPRCYTEISPSGKGIKIIGLLPEQERIVISFGPHHGIEVYARDRFFAITGQQLHADHNELADLTPAIAYIQTTYAAEIAKAKVKPAQTRQEAPRAATRPTIEQRQAKDTGDRKRQYNDAHDLLAMMQQDGATIVSRQADGSVTLSPLTGDQSGHTAPYKLTPAHTPGMGAWVGHCYSTTDKLGQLLYFDAAEYAIQIRHGGSYTSWLKATYPLAAKARTASYAEADARTASRASQDARQQADADRKAERAAAYRQQQAEIRDRVYDAINADKTLSDRAIEIWTRIYADAADHDAAYSTLSNAQLMADLGCSESTVQRAMRELAPYIRTVGQSRPIPIVRRTLIDPAVQITGVSNTAVQNTWVSQPAADGTDYVNGDTHSISKSLDSRSMLIELSEDREVVVADLDSYESYTPAYDATEPADWTAVLALFGDAGDQDQVQADEQPPTPPSPSSEALHAETTSHAGPLALMAREYLSSPDLGRETVNPATGEVKSRRTTKHFVKLVQAEYPDRWTDAEIRSAYATEQAQAQARAKAELAAYKRRLWQMPADELITYIRAKLKAEIAALARANGTAYQSWLYKFRLKVATEIAARRHIKIPTTPTTQSATARRRRDDQPAAPTQADMFALAA